MTVAEIIAALCLPDGCRIDQRVAKKLLLDNGAPTAADKRLINEAIEEIQWIAALKPSTIGVSSYCDELREYLEIAVLSVAVRATNGRPAKVPRLAELVHRAVPYPLFLLLHTEENITLSLAHKRWAQNAAGKVVLDDGAICVILPNATAADGISDEFARALSLTSQPQMTLLTLYEGWIAALQALMAARLTGKFKTADNPEQATIRHRALQDCVQLEIEAARLRKLAAKEKQLARQVEFNLALTRVQIQLTAARENL